jgi:hypothetical protein
MIDYMRNICVYVHCTYTQTTPLQEGNVLSGNLRGLNPSHIDAL